MTLQRFRASCPATLIAALASAILPLVSLTVPAASAPATPPGSGVDTGIDYTPEEFLKPDGTTRILTIWDQTDPATTGAAAIDNADTSRLVPLAMAVPGRPVPRPRCAMLASRYRSRVFPSWRRHSPDWSLSACLTMVTPMAGSLNALPVRRQEVGPPQPADASPGSALVQDHPAFRRLDEVLQRIITARAAEVAMVRHGPDTMDPELDPMATPPSVEVRIIATRDLTGDLEELGATPGARTPNHVRTAAVPVDQPIAVADLPGVELVSAPARMHPSR